MIFFFFRTAATGMAKLSFRHCVIDRVSMKNVGDCTDREIEVWRFGFNRVFGGRGVCDWHCAKSYNNHTYAAHQEKTTDAANTQWCHCIQWLRYTQTHTHRFSFSMPLPRWQGLCISLIVSCGCSFFNFLSVNLYGSNTFWKVKGWTGDNLKCFSENESVIF